MYSRACSALGVLLIYISKQQHLWMKTGFLSFYRGITGGNVPAIDDGGDFSDLVSNSKSRINWVDSGFRISKLGGQNLQQSVNFFLRVVMKQADAEQAGGF